MDGVSWANDMAREADVVFAVGTRLQDFTTGSHALFPQAKLLSLNVQPYDAGKWSGAALVADARVGLGQLRTALGDWAADAAWTTRAKQQAAAANARITELTTHIPKDMLPYDAEVIGAVRDSAIELGMDSSTCDVALCAAGTLPAELHKLWRASLPGNYHMEYGYSCMGYEVAGGLGVKMARPDQESIVLVGDGSYMMANSELATSVMLGKKIIVVVLDNRGYGCIQRLQTATGSPAFNNLLDDCVPEGGERSTIDFAMHARSMGADAVHVKDVAELKTAMVQARQATRTQVIVIDTTHTRTTDGGCWWEVAIPEVSARPAVRDAHTAYLAGQTNTTYLIFKESLIAMTWNVQIGINPISWFNDDMPSLGGETPLETALREGKEIGYVGFELGNKFPKTAHRSKPSLMSTAWPACLAGTPVFWPK